MDNDLRRIWTTERDHYVLVRTQPGEEPSSCLPFDLRTRTALVIEDAELEQQVIDEMIAAGVPIVDAIPK